MKRIYILIMALCLLLPGETRAAAFAQPDLSASGIGLSNAFTALADDASAMAYNPAGIAWQDGVGTMIGVSIPYRDSSSVITGGTAPDGGVPPKVTHFYLNWMPLDSNFGVGFGVNTPYEIESIWGDTVFGGAASKTSLLTYRTSLDGIYAINSSMAVALGVDWYYSKLELKNGAANFSGSDYGSFGGHVSWLWRPMPAWSLGAMFRYGSKLSIDGGGTGSANVQLPNEARIGLGYNLTDGLRLEVDGAWTGWSDLKSMNVTGGTGAQTNTLTLQDTFGVMTGITWTWRENTQFRFGYAFDQGANKEAGFNARLADGNNHRVSIGAGGEMFGVRADVAYAYTYFPDVTATGTFAGTYRDRKQVIVFSIGKTF